MLSKVIVFLFKRLICLPIAIIMFITVASLFPAVIIIPIYWIITNRNYVDDTFSLINYSNNSKEDGTR